MKKIIAIIGIIALFPGIASAATRDNGRIYLQVESHGEAWYVSPVNGERYYLGKPDDAYNLMRKLGLGITDANLSQLPVGLLDSDALDSDGDGLSDDLETALGTDPASADSDADDYSDMTEIENWKNPLGDGNLPKNDALVNRLSGRILLQVQKHGEAWYVNPANKKRYFLGRAADAFAVMRSLGIGITNANLEKISTNYVPEKYENSTDAAKNYTMEYPSNWVKAEADPDVKTYKGMPITEKIRFEVSSEKNYMTVYVLLPKADSTLKTLYVPTKQYANAPIDKDLIVDLKPAKQQFFKYPQPATVNDIFYNKGGEYYVDIMISKRKFIHIHLVVPESTDLARYEKQLDQIVKSMKVYE